MEHTLDRLSLWDKDLKWESCEAVDVNYCHAEPIKNICMSIGSADVFLFLLAEN